MVFKSIRHLPIKKIALALLVLSVPAFILVYTNAKPLDLSAIPHDEQTIKRLLQENPQAVETYFLNNLKEFRKSGMRVLEVTTLTSLGVLNYQHNHWEKSRHYFHEAHMAMEELKKINNPGIETVSLQVTLIKDLNIKQDFTADDLEKLPKHLDASYQKLLFDLLEAQIFLMQGEAEVSEAESKKSLDYKRAEELLLHSYKLQLQARDNPNYRAGELAFRVNWALGRLYKNARQYKEAKPFLETALKMVEARDDKEELYPEIIKALETVRDRL